MKFNNPFRVGDIVKHAKKIYVVSETKGWLYNPYKDENGKIDCHISLCRKIGEVSLLTEVSECVLFKKRESVKENWWKIFPDGEK